MKQRTHRNNHTAACMKVLLLAGLTSFMTACQTASVSTVPSGQAAPPVSDATVLATLEGAKVSAAVSVTAPKPGQDVGAKLLTDTLTSVVVDSGYDLESNPSAADIAVYGSYSADLFDRSGNYYLFDGTLSVRAVRNADNKVISQTRLVERGPRTLEDGRALEANVLQVADALSGWMARELSPAGIGIVASNVTVSKNLLTPKNYVALFINAVTGSKGVSAVRYVGADGQGANVFRVVYYPDQIPEGLLQRLRSIPDLKIR